MLIFKSFLMLLFLSIILNACSTRQISDSLGGSTAQRLVTHSIDDLVSQLKDHKLVELKGKKVKINSYFISNSPVKTYADKRLALELEERFGAQVVDINDESDFIMTVFYNSLGTDMDHLGFTIPVGYIPGFSSTSYINIITLERFHGVAEMYYFIGKTGTENRSKVNQARVKTDALGLPFFTIPISNIDR